MEDAKTQNIGITDFKNLIQSVKDNFYIDFSNYALSSLKRRVELFLQNFHFNNIDELIYKLNNDKKFFQVFLKNITVDTSEMFRDPEFWDEFKTFIIKKSKNNTELKIWLPCSNSGEELYSLLIILEKLKLTEKTLIYVSSISTINVDNIKEASLEIKKMDVNSANFDRIEDGGNLFDFFTIKSYYAQLNRTLLQNVKIIHHDIFTENAPDLFDIILFRNKMIYFNQQLKNKALNILKSALKIGGIIAVGVKESVNYPGYEREFSKVSNTEKIYKKLVTE
ncbi:MAG: hypothetical protein JXR51_16825 [Bacteroidales bacterium]|nr:hypothetical protein [Bacteroidales bacterium]MBN2758833.1 hypothetical protein [Bacteroidales bacterium]